MLQVKSFKFEQDEEVNELLSKYRLAEGASVFVSDGLVMIPYDDGEPANNALRAIDVKLQINEMLDQKNVLDFSNEVVRNMSKQLDEKLGLATADLAETVATPNSKGQKQKVKNLESLIKQYEEQLINNNRAITQNEYEMSRLDMNMLMLSKKLAELK